MSPLRILHTESSLDLGGQEFRILSEAVGMSKRGHFVLLVVQPGSQIGQYANRFGIYSTVLSMRILRFPQLIFEFLRIIKKYAINVLHTHGSVDSWAASVAGRLARRQPLVIRSRHKSTPVSDTIRHHWLYGVLPHAVVTTGEIVRQALIVNNHLPESKVVSIPSGVDVSQFNPGLSTEQIKQEWGMKSDDLIVGSVAFFRDYKGLNYFLNAAQLVWFKIPTAKFILVGNGPEQRRLEQQIIDLGMETCVKIVGFRSDIPLVLEAFDVFVMPSVHGEGVPQALTQAMAMERAVVATDIGGIPEVVKDGENGFLVKARDAISLSEKICLLLDAPDLRLRLGKTGRVSVLERYSLEGMLDATEQLYGDLLHEWKIQT